PALRDAVRGLLPRRDDTAHAPAGGPAPAVQPALEDPADRARRKAALLPVADVGGRLLPDAEVGGGHGFAGAGIATAILPETVRSGPVVTPGSSPATCARRGSAGRIVIRRPWKARWFSVIDSRSSLTPSLRTSACLIAKLRTFEPYSMRSNRNTSSRPS